MKIDLFLKLVDKDKSGFISREEVYDLSLISFDRILKSKNEDD